MALSYELLFLTTFWPNTALWLMSNEGEIMHETGRGGSSLSHYIILRDKKREGRFFSMYHSHFTDVLVTDERFSHGPITVASNTT